MAKRVVQGWFSQLWSEQLEGTLANVSRLATFEFIAMLTTKCGRETMNFLMLGMMVYSSIHIGCHRDLKRGPGLGPGWMSWMILCRNFHTGPEKGMGRMVCTPNCQVLQLFQVVCCNGGSFSLEIENRTWECCYNVFQVSCLGPSLTHFHTNTDPSAV